jgi:hypothetical protein
MTRPTRRGTARGTRPGRDRAGPPRRGRRGRRGSGPDVVESQSAPTSRAPRLSIARHGGRRRLPATIDSSTVVGDIGKRRHSAAKRTPAALASRDASTPRPRNGWRSAVRRNGGSPPLGAVGRVHAGSPDPGAGSALRAPPGSVEAEHRDHADLMLPHRTAAVATQFVKNPGRLAIDDPPEGFVRESGWRTGPARRGCRARRTGREDLTPRRRSRTRTMFIPAAATCSSAARRRPHSTPNRLVERRPRHLGEHANVVDVEVEAVPLDVVVATGGGGSGSRLAQRRCQQVWSVTASPASWSTGQPWVWGHQRSTAGTRSPRSQTNASLREPSATPRGGLKAHRADPRRRWRGFRRGRAGGGHRRRRRRRGAAAARRLRPRGFVVARSRPAAMADGGGPGDRAPARSSIVPEPAPRPRRGASPPRPRLALTAGGGPGRGSESPACWPRVARRRRSRGRRASIAAQDQLPLRNTSAAVAMPSRSLPPRPAPRGRAGRGPEPPVEVRRPEAGIAQGLRRSPERPRPASRGRPADQKSRCVSGFDDAALQPRPGQPLASVDQPRRDGDARSSSPSANIRSSAVRPRPGRRQLADDGFGLEWPAAASRKLRISCRRRCAPSQPMPGPVRAERPVDATRTARSRLRPSSPGEGARGTSGRPRGDPQVGRQASPEAFQMGLLADGDRGAQQPHGLRAQLRPPALPGIGVSRCSGDVGRQAGADPEDAPLSSPASSWSEVLWGSGALAGRIASATTDVLTCSMR